MKTPGNKSTKLHKSKSMTTRAITNARAKKQKESSRGAKNTRSTSKKKQTETATVADGLRELFIHELKDIYWAEKALTKALPKMAKNATSQELIDAINKHIEETDTHISRLEEVFETLGEKAQAKKCEAMAGLIKEGGDVMKESAKGMVRDAGIISSAQKVEHYEIATYGTLCSFANTIGEEEVALLLQETLNEEKQTDAKLSEIAESYINAEAV